MSTRLSPLERIRADIDDLFASERELGEVLEEVARLGVRLLFQTVLEAEVTEFLGRERYAHGERTRPGSRKATARPRSRPPPARSPSSAPSCGAPMRPSPLGC